MASFNATHPELQEGELFCTNIYDWAVKWILWKTKRVGNTAYDLYGNEQPKLRPVFVKKSEVIEMYGEERMRDLFELGDMQGN